MTSSCAMGLAPTKVRWNSITVTLNKYGTQIARVLLFFLFYSKAIIVESVLLSQRAMILTAFCWIQSTTFAETVFPDHYVAHQNTVSMSSHGCHQACHIVLLVSQKDYAWLIPRLCIWHCILSTVRMEMCCGCDSFIDVSDTCHLNEHSKHYTAWIETDSQCLVCTHSFKGFFVWIVCLLWLREGSPVLLCVTMSAQDCGCTEERPGFPLYVTSSVVFHLFNMSPQVYSPLCYRNVRELTVYTYIYSGWYYHCICGLCSNMGHSFFSFVLYEMLPVSNYLLSSPWSECVTQLSKDSLHMPQCMKEHHKHVGNNSVRSTEVHSGVISTWALWPGFEALCQLRSASFVWISNYPD